MFHPFEARGKFGGDVLHDSLSIVEELLRIGDGRIPFDEDEKIHVDVTADARTFGQGAAPEDALDLPTEVRIRRLQKSVVGGKKKNELHLKQRFSR